jgi:signal transduction histidine kinase
MRGRKLSLAAEIIFVVLCFFFPFFCYMIPVVLYDMMKEKRYILSSVFLVPVINGVTDIGYINITGLLFVIFITVLLEKRTSALEEKGKRLIDVLDSSTEKKRSLEEKNRSMREKQDTEIYLATLRERNRIAREIHDNVGHQLTRSILQIGALIVTTKDDTQKEELKSMKETLDNAMTSIRSSVHNLHDESIDLKKSVEDMISPLREKYTIELTSDFSDHIPGKLRLCVIGVIKEALSNIVKHSSADRIQISIVEQPAFCQLIINDNGRCTETVTENGMGLCNMRERISDAGGTISFRSSAEGFRIFAAIPLYQREED